MIREHRLGRSLFLLESKTGFWPSYCQISTIWIKFCTHLLLYGIHMWADLDHDRRVGGSRPNQNDYVFFVILVTPPKFYIETTNRRDFGFGGNRADSGSVGHGSNESTNLGGSRDPLTHNQILFILLVCCLLFCRFISHRCHHGKSHFTLYSSGIPRDFLVHGKPATALKTVLLTVC